MVRARMSWYRRVPVPYRVPCLGINLQHSFGPQFGAETCWIAPGSNGISGQDAMPYDGQEVSVGKFNDVMVLSIAGGCDDHFPFDRAIPGYPLDSASDAGAVWSRQTLILTGSDERTVIRQVNRRTRR